MVMAGEPIAVLRADQQAAQLILGALVDGQLFFASADDFRKPLKRVRIDVSRVQIWDLTGVNVVDRAVLKFRRESTEVGVVGLNEARRTTMGNLAVHNYPRAMEKVFGH